MVGVALWVGAGAWVVVSVGVGVFVVLVFSAPHAERVRVRVARVRVASFFMGGVSFVGVVQGAGCCVCCDAGFRFSAVP